MILVLMDGATLDLDLDITVEYFDFQQGSTVEGVGATITVVDSDPVGAYCGRCQGAIDPATDLNIEVDGANDWNLQVIGESGLVNDITVLDTAVGCLYLTDGPDHRVKGDIIMEDGSYIDFENNTDTLRAAAIYGPGAMEDCILGNVLWSGTVTIENNIWGSIDWRSAATQIVTTSDDSKVGRIDTSGFVGGTHIKHLVILASDDIELTTQEFTSLVGHGTIHTDAVASDITVTGNNALGWGLYIDGPILVDGGDADFNVILAGAVNVYYDPFSGNIHDLTVDAVGDDQDMEVYAPITGDLLVTAGSLLVHGQGGSFGYATIEVNDEFIYGLDHVDIAQDYTRGINANVEILGGFTLISIDCELGGVAIPNNTVPGNWIDAIADLGEWIVGADICYLVSTGTIADHIFAATSGGVANPANDPVADGVLVIDQNSGHSILTINPDSPARLQVVIMDGNNVTLIGDNSHALNFAGNLRLDKLTAYSDLLLNHQVIGVIWTGESGSGDAFWGDKHLKGG